MSYNFQLRAFPFPQEGSCNTRCPHVINTEVIITFDYYIKLLEKEINFVYIVVKIAG
jgi:hypothetical protein